MDYKKACEERDYYRGIIQELNQVIIENETMIIRLSKKIHLLQDYGAFSENDIEQIDKGL